MAETNSSTKFHIAIFPWFAMGHFIPFLHFSNRLADRGHRVSFLAPIKTIARLNPFNFCPDLISFIPLEIPHVDGLPVGAETMSDVPVRQANILCIAFDLTQNQVELILYNLKPNFIFYDIAYWVPQVSRPLGVKSICFSIVSPTITAYSVPDFRVEKGKQFAPEDLLQPPSLIFPSSSSIQLPPFLLPRASFIVNGKFGLNLSLLERATTSARESDAISLRSCRELHGPFLDYMESQCRKPVLVTGPILSLDQPRISELEERWAQWLGGFMEGSVVYCGFGSETKLEKNQFQELVLGLELTGLPFLAALKPPFGAETVEEALPEGFKERVRRRGVVHGGWVQQELILEHPSVGCFVSHCGYGSMWESLVANCQIVLVPQIFDHFLNARFMSRELKVAVEVERREEDGWFTKESVCKAVMLVMENGSQVGKELRDNHTKWKGILSREGFESSYIDNYIATLGSLLATTSSSGVAV